jgi:hypothetical protein
MKNRLADIFLIVSTIVVTAATTGRADTRWSRLAPEGAGFSVEVPGEPQPGEGPGQYSYSSGLSCYAVKLIAVDSATRTLVERRDKKALKTRLESTKDTIAATFNGRIDSPSFGEINGYPSLRFSLETEELEGTSLLVLTSDQMYMVMTVAPKGLKNADAKRFLESFRLTSQSEPPPDAQAGARPSLGTSGDWR